MAEVLPFPLFPAEPETPKPAQPPDAEARRQALDIRRSFIVEAPAGSGKTGLLIQRYLKLLADESVEKPEQVIAITFTNKATAEIHDRVLAHLEAARHDAPAPSEFDRQTRSLALAVLERGRQLEWSLLEQPHRLNIRTFDSICAEVARTLPILSGSSGRLTPVEDASTLHREAARRTLLLLGGSDDPVFDDALRNLLLHRDGDLANCESLIAEMLALRDQWGDLIWGGLIPNGERPSLDDAYLDTHLLPRLQQALEHAICATLAQLEQIFPAEVLHELTEFAAECADIEGYNGNPNPIANCSGLTQPPAACAAHLAQWHALIPLLVTQQREWRRALNKKLLGFNIEPQQRIRLQGLIDQINHREDLRIALQNVSALPPACYPPEQWAVAKSLFRVLSRALVQLQLVFADRNECDFTELSLLARHALTQDSGVEDLASALGARLQHLLVDEMQDTSASQYDLLQLLSESWDGHSQTVFLVGDPRQSIYLFRQARVERFLQAMKTERLGDLPLTPLRLTANFRSQRNLVEAFNVDFSRIFPRSSAIEDLPYEDAHAILPPSPEAAGVEWHATPLPYTPRASSDSLPTVAPQQQRQRREDAREILRIVRDWLSRPLPEGRKTIRDESGQEIPEPWRIAVLVRSRNHLAELVAALAKQQPPIPFRAIDIDTLNERQEVLDLAALTRALLHPADRVATLAVLRAPWCGLSLADLHRLTGADDPSLREHSVQRLIGERGHLLPDESRQRLARVSTVLQAATTQRARLTASQLVERAWRSLGGDAWLTAPQLVNCRRFFQLLDALEAEGGRIDPAQLDQRMERLYAEPQAISKATPCLDLLTIHRAKGLEWDVVIVPELERDPNVSPSRLLTWSVLDSSDSAPQSPDDDGPARILLAPIAGKGEESHALTRWLNRLHRVREAAEHKRLFYVACTRARQELHLFAAPNRKAGGEISLRSRSLLQAAWPAAEPLFADTGLLEDLELAAAASTDSTDSDSNIYRYNSTLVDFPNASEEVLQTPLRPALQRLPPGFDPSARFAAARTLKLPYGDPGDATGSGETRFTRPEGSFAARSFGNAVHSSLEILARRIASSETLARLLAELPAWTPRITALLRADGLPRATVKQLAGEVRAALDSALRDRDGLWVLAPHPGAASELALTTWGQSGDQRPASVRADRVFNAGPEPHAPGGDFLWIIDYKTSSHGPTGLEAFLAAQRSAYAPQLEAYARILAPAQSKLPSQVRLALYFPTLPHLIWWKPATHPATGNQH